IGIRDDLPPRLADRAVTGPVEAGPGFTDITRAWKALTGEALGGIRSWSVVDHQQLQGRVIDLDERLQTSRKVRRAVSRTYGYRYGREGAAVCGMGHMNQIRNAQAIWLWRKRKSVMRQMANDGQTMLVEDRLGQRGCRAISGQTTVVRGKSRRILQAWFPGPPQFVKGASANDSHRCIPSRRDRTQR